MRIKTTRFFAFCLLAISCLFLQPAQAECNWAPQPMPAGVSEQFVLDIDTIFTPAASYSLPPGTDFDINVLARTPAEIDARKQEAINFFLTEYGVDFSAGDYADNGNVALIYTTLDPNWNARVVFGGTQMTPVEGWVFYEARYVMTVLGSEGSTFYGNFGGAQGIGVPQTTTVVFGEWVIDAVVPCRNPDSTTSSRLHFEFYSRYPFLPDFFGGSGSDYFVTDGTDTGRATGHQTLNYLDNGDLHAIQKTVVRFPE